VGLRKLRRDAGWDGEWGRDLRRDPSVRSHSVPCMGIFAPSLYVCPLHPSPSPPSHLTGATNNTDQPHKHKNMDKSKNIHIALSPCSLFNHFI
jgi:hypothetical protein